MATGNTISGQVRVVREPTQEARIPVLKDLRQDRVDYHNNDVDTDNELFINAHHALVGAPGAAETRGAPNAEFMPGETLVVQHKANADVANDIDLDADSHAIGIVERDQNTDEERRRDLTQADQELAGTAQEETDEWVDMYQVTVPDETRIALAGSFMSVAVES
jgi:hypothetical protein